MNSLKTTIITLLALTVLVSGCSAVSEGGDDNPEPLNLTRLLDDTTDFQREIIEDGEVTSAELERALLARRDCVIAAGAVPGEIYESESNEPSFDFEVFAANEEELIKIQDEADSCLRDYYAEVGSVWAYQQLLSPEERDKLRPQAVACLDATGLTGLPENATAQDMVAAVTADDTVSDAEQACLSEYRGFFSTWTNETHEREDE
ncbi:hypothetical protein LJR042_000045 [Microbacterium maritypicum]|uniref:hypothetical protein n=1 Tax=Microbacterium maritypicum TaxID=33918 RepID=UPI003ECE8582